MFALVSLTIVNSLPLRGFAGFGTTEGVIAAVFIGFGISVDSAILTGFGLHLIMLLFQIIFGLFGLLTFKKTMPTK